MDLPPIYLGLSIYKRRDYSVNDMAICQERIVEIILDSCSSRCTEAIESIQPLQRPNPFDPQRQVQEEVPIDVVLETSDADIQAESPSDEDTPVVTPQQRQGRGQAKPVQISTNGLKIPLELDEYGGLPQQQTYESNPAIDKTVNDLWNVTARIKFKHALSELKAKCAKRNFQVKPPNMNPELWARLVYLWTEDEGHLRRSSSARANRAKGPRSRVTHTSGSMDVNVYRKKMQQANLEGHPSTFPEVYTSRRQHKGKGKDQLPVYCNDEAQEIGDIGVSTSRRELFRPPIIGQSNKLIELEQTVESLKVDNNSFRQSQMTFMVDNESLRQQQLTFAASVQQLYQHLGMTPTDTSGIVTPRTPRDI
ncbi:hypothetical protein SLEP1_g25233 [Rubroshorea leprosula]|uniref:Transposase n=1 Tax=Rubroshorea leprosula TaxID=152421 RepID=A0AAV5JLA6_9ROSI|nr:hypothetical protein SLEP1_g25233 [Rubroshorea leprosula]